MYHVAIVEDEASFATQLQEYLKQYEEENDVRFKISVFGDGAEILEDYQPLYDIILLDIEMPKVNGMKAAEQIRAQDADVTLMFITNMANYAIRGYEVGALDFVMKPINYYTFSMKMTRVLKRANQKAQQDFLVINIVNPVKEIPVFEGGLPKTTKKDYFHHGFGLKSIQYMVKKYDGNLNVSIEDGCFSLKILIPIP